MDDPARFETGETGGAALDALRDGAAVIRERRFGPGVVLLLCLLQVLLNGCSGAAVTPNETGQKAGPVLAVASFTPRGDSARTRPGAGRTIQDVVHSRLASARGIRVVARDNVDQVFREQRLRSSGFTEPGEAIDVGSILGANYIVTGSYELSHSHVYVNATVYDVKTGTSVGAANLMGPGTTMDQRYRLGRELSRRLLRNLGVEVPARDRDGGNGGSHTLLLFLFMGAFVGAGTLLAV